MKRGAFTREARAVFFDATRSGASLESAARAAGISSSSVHYWRRGDAEFRQALADARAAAPQVGPRPLELTPDTSDALVLALAASKPRSQAAREGHVPLRTLLRWLAAGAAGDARYRDLVLAEERGKTPQTVAAPPLRLVQSPEAEAAAKRAALARRVLPPAPPPEPPPAVPSPSAQRMRARRAAVKAAAPPPAPVLKRVDRRGAYQPADVRRALEWACLAAAGALKDAGACRWPESSAYGPARAALNTPTDPDERAAAFVRCLLELAERAKHDAWLTDAPVVHVAREGSGAGRKVDG